MFSRPSVNSAANSFVQPTPVLAANPTEEVASPSSLVPTTPRPEELPSPRPTKLFVGGIPATATIEDVASHFGRFGGVARVIYEASQDWRAFAFVFFVDPEGLESALASSLHLIKGKGLHCEVMRPFEFLVADVPLVFVDAIELTHIVGAVGRVKSLRILHENRSLTEVPGTPISLTTYAFVSFVNDDVKSTRCAALYFRIVPYANVSVQKAGEDRIISEELFDSEGSSSSSSDSSLPPLPQDLSLVPAFDYNAHPDLPSSPTRVLSPSPFDRPTLSVIGDAPSSAPRLVDALMEDEKDGSFRRVSVRAPISAEGSSFWIKAGWVKNSTGARRQWQLLPIAETSEAAAAAEPRRRANAKRFWGRKEEEEEEDEFEFDFNFVEPQLESEKVEEPVDERDGRIGRRGFVDVEGHACRMCEACEKCNGHVACPIWALSPDAPTCEKVDDHDDDDDDDNSDASTIVGSSDDSDSDSDSTCDGSEMSNPDVSLNDLDGFFNGFENEE